MKTSHLVLCSLTLCATVAVSQGATLYGSTSAGGAGELWILDPSSGAGLQDIGPLNDALGKNYAVTGLAFDPLNGVLYGSTGGKTGTQLLTINPATAQVSVIGSFNAGSATMADLDFDSAGHLYGIGSAGGPTLYSISLGSGQATAIGPSGPSFTAGGGLAISSSGVFYGVPEGNDFGTYNPTTGAYTFVGTMATPAGANTSYASLSFNGSTLYGVDLGGPPHLVTIDVGTGNVTDLGSTPASIDGIAFTVPEPGSVTLLLGAGLCAACIRRRRQSA